MEASRVLALALVGHPRGWGGSLLRQTSLEVRTMDVEPDCPVLPPPFLSYVVLDKLFLNSAPRFLFCKVSALCVCVCVCVCVRWVGGTLQWKVSAWCQPNVCVGRAALVLILVVPGLFGTSLNLPVLPGSFFHPHFLMFSR